MGSRRIHGLKTEGEHASCTVQESWIPIMGECLQMLASRVMRQTAKMGVRFVVVSSSLFRPLQGVDRFAMVEEVGKGGRSAQSILHPLCSAYIFEIDFRSYQSPVAQPANAFDCYSSTLGIPYRKISGSNPLRGGFFFGKKTCILNLAYMDRVFGRTLYLVG
jgi:hypothetical protein